MLLDTLPRAADTMNLGEGLTSGDDKVGVPQDTPHEPTGGFGGTRSPNLAHNLGGLECGDTAMIGQFGGGGVCVSGAISESQLVHLLHRPIRPSRCQFVTSELFSSLSHRSRIDEHPCFRSFLRDSVA